MGRREQVPEETHRERNSQSTTANGMTSIRRVSSSAKDEMIIASGPATQGPVGGGACGHSSQRQCRAADRRATNTKTAPRHNGSAQMPAFEVFAGEAQTQANEGGAEGGDENGTVFGMRPEPIPKDGRTGDLTRLKRYNGIASKKSPPAKSCPGFYGALALLDTSADGRAPSFPRNYPGSRGDCPGMLFGAWGPAASTYP